MNSIEVFEKYAQEYDDWFEKNNFIYESEILALKTLVPKEGKGLEVGVGTGRFATRFGIKIGVEPAKAMADIARKQGIKVYDAKAEKLPFDDESFDFILMVTTLCFLQNPITALQEVKRVLKPNGYIIIGMTDKNSPVGKSYETKKSKSEFYADARFYSAKQVLDWLEELGFKNKKTCQTIFKNPVNITFIEQVKEGYGEGCFVVISAQK